MGELRRKLAYLKETKAAIKDAIVEKGQTVTDSDTFRSYADKIINISNTTEIDKAYEAGKKAEHDAFWDVYQKKGARDGYTTAFSGNGWNKETFRPKYDLIVNDGYMMFRYHNSGYEPYDLAEHLETLGVTLKLSYVAQYLFAYANVSRIPPLDFSIGLKAMQQTFAGCNAVTIDKIKVASATTYSGAFDSMVDLENLLVEGTIGTNGFNVKWSTKLTRESLVSIINALSTTTSGLSVSLSQEAVNAAFTTDEWNTLIATKPNWTISLT